MAVSGGGGGSGGAIRAARAFVEVYWEDNALKRGVASAQKRWAAFGSMVGGAGRTLAAAGIGAGAALGAVFKSAIGRSAEFGRLSQKLGDSTENLSAFSYAAETTGMSLEDLVDNFENWPERLTAASQGTGEAAEAFNRLGLDAGELMKLPITEQMIALAGAMGQVGNNSERLAILGNLFSDKGQWFNSLFAKGPEGIRQLMAEAGSVGAVVTTEQAAAAGRIDAALSKAWIAAKNGFLAVGEALVPTEGTINRMVAGIVAASQAVRGWIANNQELVIGAALVLAGMTAVGLALSLLGPAIAAASAAWGVFSAAVSAGTAVMGMIKAVVLTPILLIPVAIAGAVAAFLTLTEQGQALLGELGTAISDAFGPTLESVKESWGDIVAAVERGDFESAWTVGLATVRVEWARLMAFFERTFNEFFNSKVGRGLFDFQQKLAEIGIGEKMEGLIIQSGPKPMTEGEAALAQAQAELDAARQAAREKEREFQEEKKKSEPAKKAGPPSEERLAQVQQQIRAAFAGSAGAGFFQAGYSGLERVARDQLKKQEEQLAALGRIDEGVRGIDGVRFGEAG
ncbi:MAG: hypothetical protein KF873_01975 [Gemmataceae bacterium]|nr:hypothetical protein [Gemmataceae bacterium]